MVGHASLLRRCYMPLVLGISSCLVTALAGTAAAQTCGLTSGGFGNAGFAAGYAMYEAGSRGMHVGRGVFIGCGAVQPRTCAPLVCRPYPSCWNPCQPAPCWPTVCQPTLWVFAPSIYSAPAYGWGGWGWPGGWYGTSWYSTTGSVFLAAPYGGAFFSGGVMPVPTVARSKPAPASNAATRQRAARLVAAGDRHLATAAGDAARLRAALDAYRRAAAIARDEPDTFIRQALALEALGQAAAADKPLAQAVALDGRLAAAGTGSRSDAPPDPAFGARAAGEPAPLALRGQAILQQIAAAAPGDDRDGRAAEAIAWLAERWSGRWQGEAATAVVRR
jgi:tetratricopeptide (TPR) repeat protein